MTTTDTRIAELLGWERVPGLANHYKRSCPKRKVRRGNFTTDLNLTVREIERKGWKWNVGRTGGSGLAEARICGGKSDVRRLGCRESDPPGVLARTFLAALEAEKEGE